METVTIPADINRGYRIGVVRPVASKLPRMSSGVGGRGHDARPRHYRTAGIVGRRRTSDERELVTAIITDKGIARDPYETALPQLVRKGKKGQGTASG